MKKFLLVIAVLIGTSSIVSADEPLFMTRAEIKAYVDQQIDAKIANVVDVAVEKSFARHSANANGYVQNANSSWSCPAGTACCLSASQFGVTYTYTSDDPSDDSGATGKRKRFHFFGKPHFRP